MSAKYAQPRGVLHGSDHNTDLVEGEEDVVAWVWEGTPAEDDERTKASGNTLRKRNAEAVEAYSEDSQGRGLVIGLHEEYRSLSLIGVAGRTDGLPPRDFMAGYWSGVW